MEREEIDGLLEKLSQSGITIDKKTHDLGFLVGFLVENPESQITEGKLKIKEGKIAIRPSFFECDLVPDYGGITVTKVWPHTGSLQPIMHEKESEHGPIMHVNFQDSIEVLIYSQNAPPGIWTLVPGNTPALAVPELDSVDYLFKNKGDIVAAATKMRNYAVEPEISGSYVIVGKRQKNAQANSPLMHFIAPLSGSLKLNVEYTKDGLKTQEGVVELKNLEVHTNPYLPRRGDSAEMLRYDLLKRLIEEIPKRQLEGVPNDRRAGERRQYRAT